MKLHNLLNSNLVLLDRPVASKVEAIKILLKEFSVHYPFKLNLEELEMSVLEREALGGTTFPTGLAVPHARLENLNDIVILILRPRIPIPDPTAPIRLLVVMLTSQAKPALYLNALSSFLKLSQDQAVFDKLVKTSVPKEFIDVLMQKDYSLVKVVTVEDILSEDYYAAHEETTLKDLLDVFFKKSLSYAPVVDSEGNLVGEVSLLDTFQRAFPDYAVKIGNLKFLQSFEPFETLIQQEDKILVKDLMKPISFACSTKASLVEVSFEFIQKGRRHCPVISGRKLLGVLSIMDILSKVIRG